MGREVKRVPIDFKWPMNQIWKGYYHPFRAQECKTCGGTGENPEYRQLSDDWHDFNDTGRRWINKLTQDEVDKLAEKGRLTDFVNPTAEQVNIWSKSGFGHDAINKWICVKQRAKRWGISDAPCEYCNGEGSFYPTEEIAKMAEDWDGFDPPNGEGFQMWETTSEGSPISPVFDSPEGLARWLTDSGASAFAGSKASYDSWLRVANGGYAPSAVLKSGGEITSGVEGL